jgi:hypothetical protein
MFCPRCRSEFVEGVGECPECRCALEPRSPQDDERDAELVAVFQTGDPTLLPLVQSTLEAAGVPFVTQGEEALGLLPLGQFGMGVMQPAGGAQILVPRAREAEARTLIEEAADVDLGREPGSPD